MARAGSITVAFAFAFGVVAAGAAAACQGGQRAAPARDAAPSPPPPAVIDAPPAMPIADCPVPHVADGRPIAEEVDALLEAAHKAADAGRHAEAWTCADRAADLEPDAVEAHHLRAEALAALGFFADAELVYQLALALDPTDPETLRALADFELSVRPDPPRDAIRIAAELARRGRIALGGKPADPKLETALYVLEAQAQNELNRPDKALALADKALARAPDDADARYERAAALSDLLQFPEAEVAYRAVLAITPDDPFAHDGLAVALEWQGKVDDAEVERVRARQLAPDAFHAPVIIPVTELRAEIDAVLATLPPARRARVQTVPIEIADRPTLDDLRSVQPPFPPTILGLYRGMPDGVEVPGAPPRAIVLYRLNLGRAVRTRDELREQVKETLLHEIGHFEGMDEDDLRRHGLE
jgi:tetratricopeptide (TPR) repeat protein